MRWFNKKKTGFKKVKSKGAGKSIAVMGTAGVLAVSTSIGAPMALHHEGMRLKPYYDSVGVRTVCVGETEYVEEKQYTKEECKNLFTTRYGWYSRMTMRYYNETAKTLVTPEIHAAFTDMSYNVGLSSVKKSSMIKNINNAQPVKACNSILKYKYAGGFDCSIPGNKVCAGIWSRRLQMNKLCLSGIVGYNQKNL